MYLLDTNVVSELRRLKPHGAVLAWIRVVEDAALNISAATLGELQAGVEITRERDEPKASELQAWVDLVPSLNVTLGWNEIYEGVGLGRSGSASAPRQPVPRAPPDCGGRVARRVFPAASI